MASIQVVRPRRKKKVLSRSQQLSRAEFAALELDGRIEAIRSLVRIGLMQVHEELDREVIELAGERYARKGNEREYRRHRTNPGTVKLAGQRVGIEVPRVRGSAGEVRLSSYQQLHQGGELDETMFRRFLYGISCRDYEAASEAVPGAIGLSSSTVSRRFQEASGKRLKELMERDLTEVDVVALFVNGRTFAEAEMVLAVGVTVAGQKVMLGVCQTATENARAIGQFFGDLKSRGLSVSSGILVVIDGSKGLRRAMKDAFGAHALVQRCQWHKRENVVSYLAKGEQAAAAGVSTSDVPGGEGGTGEASAGAGGVESIGGGEPCGGSGGDVDVAPSGCVRGAGPFIQDVKLCGVDQLDGGAALRQGTCVEELESEAALDGIGAVGHRASSPSSAWVSQSPTAASCADA